MEGWGINLLWRDIVRPAILVLTTHMGIEPPFVEQTSKNISFLVRAMHKF